MLFSLRQIILLSGMASLLLLGASSTAQAQNTPDEQSFRIALPLAGQTRDGAGCYSIDELTDPSARAYAEHLSARLLMPVELCLSDTTETVASQIRGDEVSMGWAGHADALPPTDLWRTILALRTPEGIGRAPAVLFARHEIADAGLDELDTTRIGYVGAAPRALNVTLPRRTLESFGIDTAEPDAAHRFEDLASLFQALDNGDIVAGAIEASSWGRYCAVLDADDDPCGNYSALIYDRPQAHAGFLVSQTLDASLIYRLIGIHIALHLDNPAAFHWLTQDDGTEFEPAEATALQRKSRARAVATW